MSVTVNWGSVSSLATYLATELDGLADSTSDTTGFSVVGEAIGSATATAFNRFMALSLNLGTTTATRSSAGFVAVYANFAADGTNYDSTTSKTLSQMLAYFPVDESSSSRRLTRADIPIPPLVFKMQVLNDTGVKFTATGNTLAYLTYNELLV